MHFFFYHVSCFNGEWHYFSKIFFEEQRANFDNFLRLRFLFTFPAVSQKHSQTDKQLKECSFGQFR